MAKRGRPRKNPDMVNSPAHYASGDVECIDAMVSAFGKKRVEEYAEIAAFKYIWRQGKKVMLTRIKTKLFVSQVLARR